MEVKEYIRFSGVSRVGDALIVRPVSGKNSHKKPR